MLYSYYFILSPRQKHQLLWSWFVNVHGLLGHNVAADLHMEHLNHICKQAIQGVGAKKRKESITRIGKALGPLAQVTANFDKDVLMALAVGALPPTSFPVPMPMYYG